MIDLSLRLILSAFLALFQIPAGSGLPLLQLPMGGITTSGGGSNPAFVQAAANHCATATTCAITVSAVGAGHGLYVVCLSTGSCSTPTATGETFSTFTGTSGCQDFTADFMQCWIVSSTVGGETSISVNTSGSASIMGCAVEFTRPQALATPKDAGGHGENAGATSFSVSTSAATTVQNDFVIGAFGSFAAGNANPFTVGGGYTQATNDNFGAGQNGLLLCEYVLSGTSLAVQTATATNAGTSARATYSILAVKP